MNNFKILKTLSKDKLICKFLESRENESANDEFLFELYKVGGETDFLRCLSEKIIYDDNAFSRACATGKENSYLKKAFSEDLRLIFRAAETTSTGNNFNKGAFLPPLYAGDSKRSTDELALFYSKNGCGDFAKCSAFNYLEGRFIPIENAKKTELSQLKDYDDEKRAIDRNINFLMQGLPFSDMLLYGDKGTGKSSTVHAMLNKYSSDGLRLVQLDKAHMGELPELKRALAPFKLKFIIFIDDLSVDGNDEALPALKTALEGSFTPNAENVMIVATSNRRHIVKESLSDRENSIHPSDTAEELLSLSDRFGLCVRFGTTDKEKYLSIVSQLVAEFAPNYDKDELNSLAERWAIQKGGRSPRRAKQFADYLFACIKSGSPVDF